MKLRASLALVATLIASAAGAQTAGDYPVRPIRMVLPFGPGGASDFVGRITEAKAVTGLLWAEKLVRGEWS